MSQKMSHSKCLMKCLTQMYQKCLNQNVSKNVSLKMSHKMSQSVLASLEPLRGNWRFLEICTTLKSLGLFYYGIWWQQLSIGTVAWSFMTTPRCTHELPSAADGIEKRRLKQCWNLSSTHTADRFDRDMIPQLLPFRHAAFQITKWRAPS